MGCDAVCFDGNISNEYALRSLRSSGEGGTTFFPDFVTYVTSHARNFHAENLTHLMSLIKISEEFRYITKMAAIAQSI